MTVATNYSVFLESKITSMMINNELTIFTKHIQFNILPNQRILNVIIFCDDDDDDDYRFFFKYY